MARGAAAFCGLARWAGAGRRAASAPHSTASSSSSGPESAPCGSGPAGSPASPLPAASPSAAASASHASGRSYSSAPPAAFPAPEGKEFMWARYSEMKRLVQDLLPPGVCNLLNQSNVYANNEVCLGDIEVYGFDYDYTLALYSSALHNMIYDTARDILVDQHKYPEGLRKYDYLPNFAVRGLHYDINKGLLMKIDAFHYIQMGTVYRGLKPVPDEEVMDLYQGTHHIPLHQVSGFYGKGPAVKQFMDIFSLPEMTLLAVANDFFVENQIEYDPIHLYKDVSAGRVQRRGTHLCLY